MKLRQLLDEYGRIVQGVNTTQDVDIYTTKREAAKFGNTVDKDGRPPLITKQVNNVLKKMSPKIQEDIITDSEDGEPMTMEQLVAKLNSIGYKEIKGPNGNVVSVLVDNADRKPTLLKIEKAIPDAKYNPTPSSASSLGHIEIGKLKVLAKPKARQGAASAGLSNEFEIINTINKLIEQHGPIDIRFKAPNKTLFIKNVTTAEEVGRTAPKGAKADIILHGDRKFNISLKQDNAQYWARTETSFGEIGMEKLKELKKKNKIKVTQPEGTYYRIEPEVAWKADNAAKHTLVFGSDRAVVVKKTFTTDDFIFTPENNRLTINISHLIKDLNDLSGEYDVYFLLRNDRTRNAKKLVPGIAMTAVMPGRVNKNTLLI